MRFPDWEEVELVTREKLTSSLRALETCEIKDIERIRGRIEAYRMILNLKEEQPINIGTAQPFLR